MKLGVLGGTFDPVHRGHVMMAEEARDRLALDEVLLVPAGRSLTHQPDEIAPDEHRLAMLRLAIDDLPRIKVSTIEIDRPGPSYTVDTLTELLKIYGESTAVYFILGWDSLIQLPRWHEPARIIELCRLVAIPRPGCPRPDIGALEAALPGISRRLIFLERPQVDISASSIRGRVIRGEPITDLVPEKVAECIRENRLYLD